ncbi:holo-ACP synthase [Candidatus Desantisbacteria bacterium]|nr:holo-ACP synthase [Candidatus Desantisbacteria bacterium]
MIYGIGVDIVEVSRIKSCIEKWGDHFLGKIFLQDEIDYCKIKKNPYPHAAARFAAKESVFKAMGSLPYLIGWKDIEIRKEESGKPFLVFSSSLKDYLAKYNNFSCHLSISHTEEYAVAQVIVEI